MLRNLHAGPQTRLVQMASHYSDRSYVNNGEPSRVSLANLPKSNVFTSKLPPDPAFQTPESSHKAPREALGPRLVNGALFTYVRPEPADGPELLSVSPQALRDLGLKDGEEDTQEFRDLVAGNKIFWNQEDGGIYPWAQCYGGEASTALLKVHRFGYLEANFVTDSVQVGNCMLDLPPLCTLIVIDEAIVDLGQVN